MADKEQVKILKQGAAAWNTWRRNKNNQIELSGIRLEGANLSGIDLRGANLSLSRLTQVNLEKADLAGANLFKTFLVEANLEDANLQEANLSGADLVGANLDNANFTNAALDAADLSWASLRKTNLSEADLTLTRFRSTEFRRTNFTKSQLDGTLFVDVDLHHTIGLHTCDHLGPSTIDHITLQNSGELPLRFLRGVGLQEALIMSLPKIREAPGYYSCFISYSHKDEKFAQRLHKDLMQSNIMSWFAPHDMLIGAKVLDEIDGAIRMRERVLLILSESSIASEWVEDEVTTAFEEERKRERAILFPIRIDDSIMNSNEPWAAKLRARHIGDFRRWTNRKVYEEAFERVRRGLTR
jgi:uncharacterized protein YjbI with pentapeptide repeats